MSLKSRFITLQEAEVLCEQLAERVRELRVDCVVSIESGGWFVGDQVARQLELPHLPITVRRFSNEERGVSECCSSVTRRFLAAVWHDLFRASRTPQVLQGIPGSHSKLIEGKRVLLVDDAIHSGKTVHTAREYLFKLGSVAVPVAALASVRGFQPSYLCMLEGHRCYPWSKISPEYAQFQSVYLRGH